MCRDNVCRRAPSPYGVHRPLGAGGGGVKNSKMGGGLIRAADSYHFYFHQRCQMWSNIRAKTCAHSGVEPSRSVGRFYKVGQKVRKNFEFFTISTLYVPISQKVLKIEAYKQRTEKKLYLFLSNCRMCSDPSPTGFCRVSQKVTDVIPVLRLTPIGTQPSAVSVFLSVAKSHM